MHYYQDNQYADKKKAVGYARLITDQNLFVLNESEKYIKILSRFTIPHTGLTYLIN
jgi:hypothetical protein